MTTISVRGWNTQSKPHITRWYVKIAGTTGVTVLWLQLPLNTKILSMDVMKRVENETWEEVTYTGVAQVSEIHRQRTTSDLALEAIKGAIRINSLWLPDDKNCSVACSECEHLV